MQRELTVYLWDLQQALSDIESFTSGKTLADYLSVRMLRSAVERQFITVGEVISKVTRYFPETTTRIDDAQRIADFRPILVHDYSSIKDEEVWRIITNSVPVLKQQVDAWLRELDPQYR